MRNLRRRIEVLERARSAARDDRQAVANRALRRLRQPELEGVIGAFGAEREGRDLSADESAAKQSYTEALTRECRLAGYASSGGFKDAFHIPGAIIMALAGQMSDSELSVAIRAKEALQEGRTPSPEESAALQTWDAQWARLTLLAGLPVPTGEDAQGNGAR